MTQEERYMAQALELARQAAEAEDIPVGCVVVKDGRVIGQGYNRRVSGADATAHAELEAIRAACAQVGSWRLDGCELYVTLEPCPMCAGAIVQARIPKVYIGSMNPKAGCAGSVLNLLQIAGFNHQVKIVQGVCQEECSVMLSDFFKELREKKKRKKHAPEQVGEK